MERKEAIRGACQLAGGNSFYDGIITCTTLSGEAVRCLVRDMDRAECDACLEKALSGIPEQFSGRLLEGIYADVDMGNLKSIVWFVCRKAEQDTACVGVGMLLNRKGRLRKQEGKAS